jgi:hypothetical protein
MQDESHDCIFGVSQPLTREGTNKVSLTPNFELEKPLGSSWHGALAVNSRQARRQEETPARDNDPARFLK